MAAYRASQQAAPAAAAPAASGGGRPRRSYTGEQMARRHDADVIAAAGDMGVSPRTYARRMARGVEGYDPGTAAPAAAAAAPQSIKESMPRWARKGSSSSFYLEDES